MKVLSSGANAEVVSLEMGELGLPTTQEWVGKLFKEEDSYPEWEHLALTQMGGINSLMVGVWEEILEIEEGSLLVMERLYPLQPRAIDKPNRLKMLKKFLKQLKELHLSGWAHGDIKRPQYVTNSPDELWDNIIPTLKGIRLIDAGSAIQADDPMFEKECLKDLADFCEFAKWFVKDVIPERDMIPKLLKWMNL